MSGASARPIIKPGNGVLPGTILYIPYQVVQEIIDAHVITCNIDGMLLSSKKVVG